MAITVPKVGQVQILKTFLNIAGNKLKLFSNNVTLSVDTVIGDLTEVTGGGYAQKTLTAGNWNFTQGTPSVALYSVFETFTFSGTPSVPTAYGYYVIDNSGNLIFAERFSSVVALSASATVPVKPKVTCKQAA